MPKEHNHEYSVSLGQEIQPCHSIRTLPASSISLLSLNVTIILTASIVDQSAYFKFNINEIIQNIIWYLVSFSEDCLWNSFCKQLSFVHSQCCVILHYMKMHIYLTIVVSADVFVISSFFAIMHITAVSILVPSPSSACVHIVMVYSPLQSRSVRSQK